MFAVLLRGILGSNLAAPSLPAPCVALAQIWWHRVTHSTAICDSIAAIPPFSAHSREGSIDLRYPPPRPTYPPPLAT